MKLRKRRVILGVIVLAVLSASIGGWYWRHTTTPEYKARKLVDELRQWHIPSQPGILKRRLIQLRLMKPKEHRDYKDIAEDFAGLGKVGVDTLIRISGDEDWHMRDFAAYALGEMGPVAKDAIPVLFQACKDKNSNVRTSADLALWRIGLATEEAVPTLIRALKDDKTYWRRTASGFLGEIGPVAKEAIPALREALKDEDEYVRRYAAEALKKIEAK